MINLFHQNPEGTTVMPRTDLCVYTDCLGGVLLISTEGGTRLVHLFNIMELINDGDKKTCRIRVYRQGTITIPETYQRVRRLLNRANAEMNYRNQVF